jgi:hypothetical protein
MLLGGGATWQLQKILRPWPRVDLAVVYGSTLHVCIWYIWVFGSRVRKTGGNRSGSNRFPVEPVRPGT